MIELPKHSDLLKLPEQLYGTIKKVGVLNNKPILYGDVNLLKPGDLFYFTSAHQIYRYVKSSFNPVHTESVSPVSEIGGSIADIGGSISDPIRPESIKLEVSYIFKEIEPMLDEFMLNGLTIPDEQRGTIKRVGKLFNKIIYSGDPDLVDNGNLYYHEAFPLISTVRINHDGVITLSADWIGMYDNVSTMNVEYRVSPISTHDYSQDYLTFEALEDSIFTFTMQSKLTTEAVPSISYSLNNGSTWTTVENKDDEEIIATTPTISAGNVVLWKSESTQFTVNPDPFSSRNMGSGIFNSTGNFNAKGNIMSLIYGNDFKDKIIFKTRISTGDSAGPFSTIFKNCTKIISAENLILPVTTLVDSCYSQMFDGCTSLTTAPTLPAITLSTQCYNYMFKNCSSLNYIKAMFTQTPNDSTQYFWVVGVAANGTFVKNSAASWNVRAQGSNMYIGIPSGWTVETADA